MTKLLLTIFLIQFQFSLLYAQGPILKNSDVLRHFTEVIAQFEGEFDSDKVFIVIGPNKHRHIDGYIWVCEASDKLPRSDASAPGRDRPFLNMFLDESAGVITAISLKSNKQISFDISIPPVAPPKPQISESPTIPQNN